MTSRTSISRRRRPVSAVVVAAFLLSITACSGGGAPPPASPATVSPSPSASSTPSATPTPTASYKPADATGKAQNVPVPVLPEAAKAETKEGLEAFARYWFQLLSYGYETGDPRPLVEVTSSACSACEHAKTCPGTRNGIRTDGGWSEEQIATPSVQPQFVSAADGNYQVAIQVQQSPVRYYNADGSLDSADRQTEDTGNLMLAVFTDGSWRCEQHPTDRRLVMP